MFQRLYIFILDTSSEKNKAISLNNLIKKLQNAGLEH